MAVSQKHCLTKDEEKSFYAEEDEKRTSQDATSRRAKMKCIQWCLCVLLIEMTIITSISLISLSAVFYPIRRGSDSDPLRVVLSPGGSKIVPFNTSLFGCSQFTLSGSETRPSGTYRNRFDYFPGNPNISLFLGRKYELNIR